MGMSERKHNLLIKAIDDYIKDASPITSGGAKEKYIQKISTATLRSELNALEAMGYLKQLHTSGGRVPTTEGYRYYVNELIKGADITSEELDEVKISLSERSSSLEEVIAKVTQIVSKATNYPTVLLVDGLEKLLIEEIKIIPLVSNEVMLLIKTPSGYLNNNFNVQASEKACQDASSYLTRVFQGQTLSYMFEHIEEIEMASKENIENFKSIVNNLIIAMQSLMKEPMLDIHREGSAKLLSSGESLEETKKIFNLLEDRQELIGKLKMQNEETELEVDIAEENEKLSGCAIIKAPIVVRGEKVATIGVLGPQRMNYASIASALRVVMGEISENKQKEHK